MSGTAGDIRLLISKKDLGGRTIFPAITGRSAAAEAAANAALRRSAIRQGLPVDFAVGLIQAGIVELVTASGAPPVTPMGAGVAAAGRDEINAGNRGVFGEFTHWKLYQSFHMLTGTPLPNNPNSPLSEF